jgi:ADP-ribose pyrophosphatase
VSRKASRRAYTGRVISLDVDTVEFPNGITGELEMVRHPGASAVVPFLDDPSDADPRILLIRQYRYASEGFLLEIPAGRLDEGETPEACAFRELREETGYSAEKVEALTTFYTTPGFTDERIHLFMATGLKAGDASLEDDEILDLHPVSLAGAVQMVRAGEIIDGKSMLGVLLAAARTSR